MRETCLTEVHSLTSALARVVWLTEITVNTGESITLKGYGPVALSANIEALDKFRQNRMFGRKQGDPRVKRILDSLELPYSVDEDGDFEIGIEFENGRSQLAYINSNTEYIDDFEVREIWSVSFVSEGFLDVDTANTLLLKNYETKIGAWRLIPAGDNTYLVAFCVHIAADCDPNALINALQIVWAVADNMEESLTGDDCL